MCGDTTGAEPCMCPLILGEIKISNIVNFRGSRSDCMEVHLKSHKYPQYHYHR